MRIGVIGAGNISVHHLMAWTQCAGASVVAIWPVPSEKIRMFRGSAPLLSDGGMGKAGVMRRHGGSPASRNTGDRRRILEAVAQRSALPATLLR